MIPLLIVRPEPGAAATLHAARSLGLDADAYPIFTVEPLAWEPVARGEIDAVLLGSANALRHAGSGLEPLRGLPAYCVGQATAEAAREAGLAVIATGSGGLQAVLETLDPAHRRLLRLAGASRVPLRLPEGVSIQTRSVYEGVALPLPGPLGEALQERAVVMLHSGEAARHFDAICGAGIDRSRIALALIGPRLVPLAGEGWRKVRIAARPGDAALLALAREMCQDAAGAPKTPDERPDAGR